MLTPSKIISNLIQIALKLNSTSIRLLYYTGAGKSILKIETVKCLGLQNDINKSSLWLTSYTEESLKVLGELEIDAAYQGISTRCNFAVVRRGSEIIGIPEIKKFIFLPDQI